jgi:hypothetical protein
MWIGIRIAGKRMPDSEEFAVQALLIWAATWW